MVETTFKAGCSVFRAVARMLMCVVVLCVVGCGSVSNVVEEVFVGPRVPQVKIESTRIDRVTDTDIRVTFNVKIMNRSDVNIRLIESGYSISSKSIVLTQGTRRTDDLILARTNRFITVSSTVNFRSLMATMPEVERGTMLPYLGRVALTVETPLAKAYQSLTAEQSGKLPIPTDPHVRVAQINWRELHLNEAIGSADLEVYNPNPFSLDLTNIKYSLQVGGAAIVTGYYEDKSLKLKPGQSVVLRTPLSISPIATGIATFRALSEAENEYMISGTMACDSIYGPIPFSYRHAGKAPLKK